MPRFPQSSFLSLLARDVLAAAREAHREGRLGFLVGAGLSLPIGLPGWSTFNRALVQHGFDLNSTGAHPPDELGRAYLDQIEGQELTAVDFVRQRVGDRFHLVVRRALYEREELQKFAPTEVHYALARLAVESKPAFPCLHTTNYDELLEVALTAVAGSEAQSVHASSRSWSDGPRVVHLHGFFPQREPKQRLKKELAHNLILSEFDYNRLANDHSAWTNRELLHLLDARSVLIIGMSLTDPNVRRLLAYLSERSRDDQPRHFVVLQDHTLPGMTGAVEQAANRLDEDEYAFWDARNVQILRIEDWDRLNYLLRRIRFTDDEWNDRHHALRTAWAGAIYGDLDFNLPEVQRLGTAALAVARDELKRVFALSGRVELNLFLPDLLAGGEYRRALSSMAGRALEAPRRFRPQPDAMRIPEVEEALILGQPVRYSRVRAGRPLDGEPPFQDWYRALVSVPYFDHSAGGIPVAVVQLCSSHDGLEQSISGQRVNLTRYLREAVFTQFLEVLGRLRTG